MPNGSFSASPETLSNEVKQRRVDDLQPQLRRAFLEQLHLLVAVALFVVLQAFGDVLVSPPEHAIHQNGRACVPSP
jgi:hypothetical protein